MDGKPKPPCKKRGVYCKEMTAACIGYCKKWQKFIAELKEYRKAEYAKSKEQNRKS